MMRLILANPETSSSQLFPPVALSYPAAVAQLVVTAAAQGVVRSGADGGSDVGPSFCLCWVEACVFVTPTQPDCAMLFVNEAVSDGRRQRW